MGKNLRLADIYIKIYNKKPLTLDDLAFLAKYDRECFEKTYRNLLYNIPEAESIMQLQDEECQEEKPESNAPDVKDEEGLEDQKGQEIHVLLDNLRKMEVENLEMQNVDADRVKNLLGSLYMEMLFPHNDKYRYFQLEDHVESSIFNKKA